MSNSAADGVRWTSTLDGVVAETGAGRLLPGCTGACCGSRPPPARRLDRSCDDPPRRPGRLGRRGGLRIASVTKMMTATALLVLADQGPAGSTSAGRYLPRDVVDRFRDSTGRAFAAAVTLRQLLDHTSGLPNFFSHPPILEAVQHGDGRRRFTPADLVDLAVAGEPPTSPPGTVRAYTDTGFLLAGLIIEALTDKPLQQAYRDGAGPGRHGRHVAGEQR